MRFASLKMNKFIVAGAAALVAVLSASRSDAGTDNGDVERVDAGTEKKNEPVEPAKSYHQLSLGLMIPVGGGAGSMNDSCGLYEKEACPDGDMAPVPGIIFSYDFRPFKYLSFGTSIQYQSYWAFRHVTATGHQAEILKLGLFLRGLLPVARERVDLYFLAGWYPSFNWVWNDGSYYGFQTVPLSFGIALGGVFWITKHIGVYWNMEMYLGGVGGNVLWYVPLGLGVAARF